MVQSFVKCPKDPEMQYDRDVCQEIFRKGDIRNWCKQCEVFQDQKEPADQAIVPPVTRPA